FAVEIGKATFDVEAEASGTLLDIFVDEGEEAAIKSPVCVIGEPGESYERPAGQAAAAAPESAAAESAPVSAPPAASGSEPDGLFVSPRARAAAERMGVDYSAARASGAEGRIIERDVAALAAGRPAEKAAPVPEAASEEEFSVVPNSGIRRVIAKNMHESLANMAQLSMSAYFDATDILAFREKLKAQGAELGYANISLNDMVLFAVSRVLASHPALNAHYSDREMKLFRHVHLGVAVDTERGLMVPTLRCADTKSLNEISAEAKALAKACRDNSVSPSALAGATITVTNLGNTGISSFTPVINPPQIAIVGVCGLEWRVRPGRDGAPELYRAMGLSLTIDHRAVDGAPASRFLQELCARLESFTLLLAR
ncbi:MAG: dihydrolipoamide acetyltransferase family protein, partial [Oscillospiraceae bacterium]|nr:dihydrolipoamide acetyltransferase family protein [Oscillospiraceae bacterium]